MELNQALKEATTIDRLNIAVGTCKGKDLLEPGILWVKFLTY